MPYKVVTPPTVEPITLDEMKSYLRVDDGTDDTLISALIIAAREYCESFQNRAYITQTLELVLDHFPGHHKRLDVGLGLLPYDYLYRGYGCGLHHHNRMIKLPMPPVQSVTSITYTDETGATSTLDPSTYIVDIDSEPARIVLASEQQWPTVKLQAANGVRIRFVAGYGTADLVPETVKQAMKMLIAHWYENRSAIGQVSQEIAFAVKALLSMQRVIPT